MKVIFLNRFFYPDISPTSRLLAELAFSLAADGRDVRVITSRRLYDDPKKRLPSREIVRGVRVSRVWTTCFGRQRSAGRLADSLSFYASATWRLLRRASAGDLVVAKTDPPLLSFPVMLAARIRGAALVNWLQDLYPEAAAIVGMKETHWFFRLLRSLRDASLRAARLNVVVGEAMADCLVRRGISADKIRVIHNWADGEAVRSEPIQQNSLRREWGLDGKFVVAYSGNMGRVHEFGTILNAAEILKPEARILFLFAGGGPQKRWIEDQAQRRGLSNIIFKPYQPQAALGTSLGAADLHWVSLLPALDGFAVPSKFYGILAAGRPVIYVGSDRAELGRLIRSSGCGYAVHAGRSEELAACIRSLSGDPALASRMGANGRALFERRFDKPLALGAWRAALNL